MPLLPFAAALLLAQPGPDAVTPRGAATLRATWLAPVPAVVSPPRVVVRWRVRVGGGGAAGPVALRVLHGFPDRARGRGATVQLPAMPGTYEFPARLRFLNGDALGLDQEAGGHAVVHQHEDGRVGPEPNWYGEHALDLWRPPLRPGEARERSERLQGAQLLVSADLEHDVDRDGHGDTTQDVNDLEIVWTRRVRRSVRVRVRNRGDRTVDMPRLLVRVRGARPRALRRPRWPMAAPRGYRVVDLRPIRPGRSAIVTVKTSRVPSRVKLIAVSEGPDPTRSRVVVPR